jgi:hypothetical protein
MDFRSQPKIIHLGIMRALLGTPSTEPTDNQRVKKIPINFFNNFFRDTLPLKFFVE